MSCSTAINKRIRSSIIKHMTKNTFVELDMKLMGLYAELGEMMGDLQSGYDFVFNSQTADEGQTTHKFVFLCFGSINTTNTQIYVCDL